MSKLLEILALVINGKGWVITMRTKYENKGVAIRYTWEAGILVQYGSSLQSLTQALPV